MSGDPLPPSVGGSGSSRVPLDILAIAAHRDDVEQTCGGTLLKMAMLGHRTGILDLTQGEMGTRGTADDRAREAAAAAKILGVSFRQALDIPDGRVENTFENKLKVARVIREQKPRVVILPYWEGRHPDHYTCSKLGYEAIFLAGLTKLGHPGTAGNGASKSVVRHAPAAGYAPENGAPAAGASGAPLPPSVGGSGSVAFESEDLRAISALAPHRPFKIVYASLYYDVRPTFVVDITDQFDRRFDALMAYKSQYEDQQAGSGLFPQHAEIRQRLESMASFYGLLAGVRYAEPFVQKEVGLVDDLLDIPVKSL